MKAKISRGGGFRGAVSYVLDKGDAECVGGNMSGRTVQEIVREFSVVKKLRPDCKNPVWHCSLALPEGERLDAEKWGEVTQDFMREMGFDLDTFLYTVQRHSDTEHDHVHIIASRIGLDGSLWHGQKDVFKAVEATQELEQRHRLTLTPGLEMDAKKERKSLKSGELNMAIREGVKPPRVICQDAIDAVLASGAVSAPVFIERLEAFGVRAVPAVASTGTMNGFSFEVDGIAFTGSKLGELYKWARLQTRGVEYVKTRDFEKLADARRAAAERARVAELGAAARSGERGGDTQLSAPVPSEAGGVGQPAGFRPGESGAAGVHRADERRAGAAIERADAEQSAAAGQPGAATGQGVDQDAGAGGGARPDAQEHHQRGQRGGAADARRSQHIESSSERSAPAVVAAGAGADSGRGRGRATGGSWADRFRAASAARRRAAASKYHGRDLEPGNGRRARVVEADRVEARAIDPTAYLESHGFEVKREGRHLSVRQHGDEVYRCTQQDGRWLWCDRYGNTGGDNIALVQEIDPGAGFAEAVYRLAGAPTVRQQSAQTARAPRQPPVLPTQTPTDVRRGREYLAGRGISLETIERAERAGMLRYAAGGVLFVGYDRAGTAQNATRRAIAPADPVQKRDLRGSDKSYPPILPGDPAKVWIVEGGADALALHDIAKRSGQQPPTVIVSGGANVRSFLERGDVQAILKRAERVTVAGENEKNPDAQARADAGHEKQARRVAEITGREVRQWTPPVGCKDLADMNLQAVMRESEQIELRDDHEYSR